MVLNGKAFWQTALEYIQEYDKILLLTVAESSNSSPGRSGFKMLLCPNGITKGTIGGGIMEKQLIDYGKELLNGNESVQIKRLQHSPKTDLEQSGLICGGYQTIIYTMFTSEQAEPINAILKNIKNRKSGLLTIKHDKFVYDNSAVIEEDITFNYVNNEQYIYQENVGLVDTAYIIGGGHVGLAVSRIMKSIGFYVVVFDHRKEIFTMDQNSYADEKIISEYDHVGNFIKEGNKSYVIIVTPAHFGDKAALGSVIDMKLKYLGMMGSKRKIKTVFNNLVKEGVERKLLEKVNTPIGLEIEAETPEEIAISIAAEIIKVKRNTD